MVKDFSELREPGLEQLTISLGATRIARGRSLDSMVREADEAMSHSRANGKNQSTIYERA